MFYKVARFNQASECIFLHFKLSLAWKFFFDLYSTRKKIQLYFLQKLFSEWLGMTRKFLDLESNCVLVSNPLVATGNKSSHVFWSIATTFEGKVLKILASLFRDYSFSLVMADEDWAAEVDEQEREISGQVSCYCIMTETRAITFLKLSRWSVVVALFS